MSSAVSCVCCNIIIIFLLIVRHSHAILWYLARKFRLCYKYLKQGHLKTDCQNSNCTQCDRPHHTLLHGSSRTKFHNKNKNRNYRQYNNQNLLAACHKLQVTGTNETPKSPQLLTDGVV